MNVLAYARLAANRILGALRLPLVVIGAGLALLTVAILFPAILGRVVFFQRDVHTYWYPHIETAVRAVAEGLSLIHI